MDYASQWGVCGQHLALLNLELDEKVDPIRALHNSKPEIPVRTWEGSSTKGGRC